MAKIVWAKVVAKYGPVAVGSTVVIIPSSVIVGAVAGAAATAAGAFYLTRSPEERTRLRGALGRMVTAARGVLPAARARLGGDEALGALPAPQVPRRR